MKPHEASYPPPKRTPRNGTNQGGFYRYGGEKKFPQPGEKPKK